MISIDSLKLIQDIPEKITNSDSIAIKLDTLAIKFPEYLKIYDPTPFYLSSDFWLSAIAVLIALIALLWPPTKQNRRERKRLKELKSYFLYLIESIIDPIDKEIEDHFAMCNLILNKEVRYFPLNKSTLVFIDHISSLQLIDLYKIFIENIKTHIEEKAKHYRNMFRSIDLLKIISQNKEQNFYQFLNTIKPIETKWDDFINLILREYDLYCSRFLSNNKEFKDDPFFRQLDQIQSKWSKSEKRNEVDYIMKELISPIQELCKKNIKDPRSNKLMELTIETERCYINIVNLRNKYSEGCKTSAEKLNQLKQKILESYNFYSNS